MHRVEAKEMYVRRDGLILDSGTGPDPWYELPEPSGDNDWIERLFTDGCGNTSMTFHSPTCRAMFPDGVVRPLEQIGWRPRA